MHTSTAVSFFFVYVNFACIDIMICDTVCYMCYDESVGISGKLIVIMKKRRRNIHDKQHTHVIGKENGKNEETVGGEENVSVANVILIDHNDDKYSGIVGVKNKLGNKNEAMFDNKYFIQSFYNLYDLQSLIIRRCQIMRNSTFGSSEQSNIFSRPQGGYDLIVEVFNYLYGNEFVQQIMCQVNKENKDGTDF